MARKGVVAPSSGREVSGRRQQRSLDSPHIQNKTGGEKGSCKTKRITTSLTKNDKSLEKTKKEIQWSCMVRSDMWRTPYSEWLGSLWSALLVQLSGLAPLSLLGQLTPASSKMELRDLKPSQDLCVLGKTPSKLPVPEKAKAPEVHDSLEVTNKENPINVALAERISELEAAGEALREENRELREELELMEFRLLEAQLPKASGMRGGCDAIGPPHDDVSDPGVTSLTSSEEEFSTHTLTEGEGKEPGRLVWSAERELEYQARIGELEATLTAMAHDPTSVGRGSVCVVGECVKPGGGRIIATVLPFREAGGGGRRESDCLQESGIFEDEEDPAGVRLVSRYAQTDEQEPHADLAEQIRRLCRIRERIEEGGNKKLALNSYTPSVKELLYYRERLETLEDRLALYESSGEARDREVGVRVEREAALRAEVARLNEAVSQLHQERSRLDEEKCELEEQENDTRLRCQKLEIKLSTLGEKKSALKIELQQAKRALVSMKESMEAEEKKKAEARQYTSRLEALVHSYEQKNFELEERELEVRYRLQMLENTMPALMMWNMWRMMYAMQGASGAQMPVIQGFKMDMTSQGMEDTQSVPKPKAAADREDDLIQRLKSLENKLEAENKLLEQSRQAEEALRHKVHDLESLLEQKDHDIADILDRDPEEDVDIFDRLSKMAKERLEADKRIRDLEMKEKLYQETLQQADDMFAELQGGFVKKMEEKDFELKEVEEKLEETEQRLAKANKETEMTDDLREKIDMLESDISRLKLTLSKREEEREALYLEEQRLYKELQDCLEELDRLKKNVEIPLREEIETERKSTRELKEALSEARKEALEAEEKHDREVTSLKRQISLLTRDMMENEVTISELKEEVQTLEVAIAELKYNLSSEKDSKEDLRRQLEAELEKKEKIIEDLRSLLQRGPVTTKKSLKEELEEEMVKRQEMLQEFSPKFLMGLPTIKGNGKDGGMVREFGTRILERMQEDIFGAKLSFKEELEDEMVEKVKQSLKEEFQENVVIGAKQTLKDQFEGDVVKKVKQSLKEELQEGVMAEAKHSLKRELEEEVAEIVKQSIKEELASQRNGAVIPDSLLPAPHDSVSHGTSAESLLSQVDVRETRGDEWRLRDGGLDVSAGQLRALVAEIEETVANRPLSNPHLYFAHIRTTDCQQAQTSVAGVSGKDIDGTIDHLNKAYHHTKMNDLIVQ